MKIPEVTVSDVEDTDVEASDDEVQYEDDLDGGEFFQDSQSLLSPTITNAPKKRVATRKSLFKRTDSSTVKDPPKKVSRI